MIQLYAGAHSGRTLLSCYVSWRTPLAARSAARSAAVTSRRAGAYGHLPLAASRIDGPVSPVSEVGAYWMAAGPTFASLVGPRDTTGLATFTSAVPSVIDRHLTEFEASATGHTPAG